VPLLVPSGEITVRFSRPGYHTVSRSLTMTEGRTATLRCDASAQQPLAASLSGRLLVQITPNDAEIRVDGGRFLGAPLPSGVHRLLIARDGFRPDERLISIAAGTTTTVDAKLAPTPASREREHRAILRRKNQGIVLGSIGVALLATSVGIYAWNSGRYDDWRSKPTVDLNRAASIQRADDASFGFMLFGAGLTLGGSWLFFAAE
jgi:hypothetical protein